MTGRVLVTGAAGFIGRRCVEALVERGFEIHAVTRERADSSTKHLQWHRCDLFEREAVKRVLAAARPTHLLHLAWCTDPETYWTSPDNERWIEASLSLFDAFAEYGHRIVAAGTSAEYEWGLTAERLSEDRTPLRPKTPYGIAKHALHLAAESFARTAGLSLGWARLFGVYGPREPRQKLVSTVASTLLQGRAFLGRAPDHERDFLYVDDAARALALLLESDARGAVNIGSGEGVPIRRVVDTIAAEIGRPDLVQPDPSPSNDVPAVVADIHRLTAATGFTPAYTLAQGIRETVEWHRSLGGGGRVE